jgi:hypothetical protein
VTTSDNQLLTAALAYATRGLAVFPLAPKGKVPYRGTHGLKDATTDANQINQWWEKYPSANIGGMVPAGYVVIDTDTDRGADFAALEPLLTTTRMAQTGSGGRHDWYRLPPDAGDLNCKPFPHVDLKTAGSYVVLPPSVTTGEYFWYGDADDPIADMSPDLLKQLQRPGSPPEPATAPSGASTPQHWYQQALSKLGKGADRNDTGHWLCQQLQSDGQTEDGATTWMRRYQENVPAKDHPYTVKDMLATVHQVYHNQTPRPPARSQRTKDKRQRLNPLSASSGDALSAQSGSVLLEDKGRQDKRKEEKGYPTLERVDSIGSISGSLVSGSLPADESEDFYLTTPCLGFGNWKKWMEAWTAVDILPSGGVVQHSGTPAQRRRNRHYMVGRAFWQAMFPMDRPLSTNLMSRWLGWMLRDTDGVPGEEGRMLCRRIYDLIDAPHNEKTGKKKHEGYPWDLPQAYVNAALLHEYKPAKKSKKKKEEDVAPIEEEVETGVA